MSAKHALLTGLVVAMALGPLWPGAPTPLSAAACTEPYSPLVWADVYPGGEHLPDVPGVDVASALVVPPLDSDGDDVADTVLQNGVPPGAQAIQRGDGVVTFEATGQFVVLVGNAGDLDDDGRDEILLLVADSQSLPATGRTWVVPGTVAPGTHQVDAVGILVSAVTVTAPGFVPPFFGAPVPDRTGDGVDDLMLLDTTSTRITSGAAIMAVGTPGDAQSVVPVLTMPGWFKVFAQLTAGLPAIVTARHANGAVEFRIGDESSVIAFTTAPAPNKSDGLASGPHADHVLVSAAGVFLLGSTSSRSGIEAYLWRVDDPCAALSGGDEVPPPVPAPPNFTG